MFKKKLEHQKQMERLERKVQMLTGQSVGTCSVNDNTNLGITKLSIDNKSNGSAEKGN